MSATKCDSDGKTYNRKSVVASGRKQDISLCSTYAYRPKASLGGRNSSCMKQSLNKGNGTFINSHPKPSSRTRRASPNISHTKQFNNTGLVSSYSYQKKSSLDKASGLSLLDTKVGSSTSSHQKPSLDTGRGSYIPSGPKSSLHTGIGRCNLSCQNPSMDKALVLICAPKISSDKKTASTKLSLSEISLDKGIASYKFPHPKDSLCTRSGKPKASCPKPSLSTITGSSNTCSATQSVDTKSSSSNTCSATQSVDTKSSSSNTCSATQSVDTKSSISKIPRPKRSISKELVSSYTYHPKSYFHKESGISNNSPPRQSTYSKIVTPCSQKLSLDAGSGDSKISLETDSSDSDIGHLSLIDLQNKVAKYKVRAQRCQETVAYCKEVLLNAEAKLNEYEKIISKWQNYLL